MNPQQRTSTGPFIVEEFAQRRLQPRVFDVDRPVDEIHDGSGDR
jgi:hypothetical protein